MVVLVALVAIPPVLALHLARAPWTLQAWAVRAGVIGLCALPATPMWLNLEPLGQLLSTTLGSMAALGVLCHALWLRSELAQFERNLAALADPNVPPATAVAVQRYLLVVWPVAQPVPSPFAAQVLAAARALAHGGFEDEADSLWRSLPERWLTVPQRIERAMGLAAAALRRGDLRASERAISSVVTDCGKAGWMETINLRATLFALLGRADEALALVGEGDGDRTLVEDRKTVLTVRAHALAARGDLEGARVALSAMRRELGDGSLDALERPSGPASVMARGFRRGGDAAYR